jgi:multidrug efflux pump subunit AcrB
LVRVIDRIGTSLNARWRDHRIWMMGSGIVALGLTVALFMSLPTEFFPESNSDFTSAIIDMVPGTTIAQTETMADRVAALLRSQPEVDHALENVTEGHAQIFITLRKDRKRTTTQLERAVTPLFGQFADARVSFQSLMNAGGSGTGRPISVMLSGSDSRLLEDTAATLVEQMKGIKDLVAPRISGDLKRPEVVIHPRLDLAATMGVSTSALSQAVRIATMGEIDQNTAKFSLTDRQIPIRVRMPEDARRDIASIANLPVQTANGGTVPLSRVAEISFGSGPTSIERYNQDRRVFIGADLAPGVVKSTATDKIFALPIMKHLPPGVSNTAFGEDRWQTEMLDNISLAVPAGILLVFAVLVLLYHRMVSPMVNMGSLFLAPLGGLLALLLTGQPLSMPVFIGFLMLLGIVAKNSILLIDFAIEEMAQGADKFAAIVEAGHKRAQPIVMTTVAMTAGMLPTALSIGGDSAWRAPMGTVVIGGLIVSTLLTLLIVPAAFSLADGLEKRLGPWLRKGLLTYEPEHGEAGYLRPVHASLGDETGVHPAE